jgi:hypothetical protein
LLHLPIGVLIALVWLQLWARFGGDADAGSRTRKPLVCLLALSTFMAALTGWLLHESASYPEPVEWHEWLGVALLVVTLFMVWAEYKKPKLYEPFLWLAFVLLFPTGHLGGTLTHGEDFIFGSSEVESNGVGPASTTEGQAMVETYESVRPVLADLCMHCHGERKRKSGLALHTRAGVLDGGESGPAWIPGDAENSLLWQVLNKPLEHDAHMPPSNKSQPDASELARLNSWLEGKSK